MWRTVAKQASSKVSKKFASDYTPSSRFFFFLRFYQHLIFVINSESRRFHLNPWSKHGISKTYFFGINDIPRNQTCFSRQFCSRGYTSAAEAISPIILEEDASGDEKIKELLQEMAKEVSSLEVERLKKEVDKVRKFLESRKKRMKLDELAWRQKNAETEAWNQAEREYRELITDMCLEKLAPNLPYMKSLFLGWFEPLRDAIAKDQVNEKLKFIPSILNQLPAEVLSVLTMHKMAALLMTGKCVKLVQAACLIGDTVEQEIRLHKLLEKAKEKKTAEPNIVDVCESQAGSQEQNKLKKDVTNFLKKPILKGRMKKVPKLVDSTSWSLAQKAKIGSHLIELLMQSAYIQPSDCQFSDAPPDIRPAFVHTLSSIGNKKCSGMIECDPLLCKGLEGAPRFMVIPYMPMLVPPLNWSSSRKGAYLCLPSFVMRTQSKKQRAAFMATPKGQLQPVFEALNVLGIARWRINKRVLNVIDSLWESGGGIAGLVDRLDIPLPEKPDTKDEIELKSWKKKVWSIRKENTERNSQRCNIELQLAVARKMKKEDGFFYPHNIDFRGRAYPMHPHLNHLGSDMCRGILEFSVGRPLKESGLRWLKIHLANLFAGGVDKLPLNERIAFTENHLDDIFDSADKPIVGRQWWVNAEDPFQFLAACINLSEALRSPSPEKTISRVHVHQDGSCNGLQHYAALGRDKLGAIAVNLVAGEKPADVYTGIAKRVLKIMLMDAKNDAESDSNALYAKMLIDQVDRKLVKQTVMTSVYGVTYVGARDQIEKRLKERGFTNRELFQASGYAAKVTLTAIGEMFQAARSIMTWLGDCAKIIASENQAVQWTTPLGLPIFQPYFKQGKEIVRTSLQTLSLQKETDMVMIAQQKAAFPPNFVHSLDSTHMMMTAVACRQAGLYFAGVHDSYWTHACDVDVMNKILREKFVELYEKPILEKLLESFKQSFPKLDFPPLPEKGDLDLREVLKSPYFFN